jgi:hypothetical protein
MSDILTLKYIPLSQAHLFEDNANLHEFEMLITSFQKYGFKSACKWEPELNGGEGAIVAGNGRAEALCLMRDRGDSPPRGVAIDSKGEGVSRFCLALTLLPRQ